MIEPEEEKVDIVEKDQTVEEDECDCAQISVNVVAWISGYRTMRVKGVFGKRSIFVLIDTVSTHNFIERNVAEKLDCT